MIFRLGEMFCGPGGLGYGALSADINDPEWGYEHVWANDYDSDTCRTYAHNIFNGHQGRVICEDVRNLDINNLEPIDAFAFGFPCNDFSTVGEQKGFEGTYGPLYTYGVKILRRFQPMFFLAENVSGLSSANEGGAFTQIMTELEGAGYRLYPHLYKFEEYGVPQSRHRIIIIGIRTDIPNVFRIPKPTHAPKNFITSRQAIEIPAIQPNAFNNELTRQSKTVIERLMHIQPGENAFTANLPNHLKLNVRGAKISQIYKRLSPDRPAYTVTGSGGGGTHIYHYSEPRALTNRERARLQTFPDDFEFLGSKESVRKQIGMAVPCKGARIIFEAVLNTFAGRNYESIHANIQW